MYLIIINAYIRGRSRHRAFRYRTAEVLDLTLSNLGRSSFKIRYIPSQYIYILCKRSNEKVLLLSTIRKPYQCPTAVLYLTLEDRK